MISYCTKESLVAYHFSESVVETKMESKQESRGNLSKVLGSMNFC